MPKETFDTIDAIVPLVIHQRKISKEIEYTNEASAPLSVLAAKQPDELIEITNPQDNRDI